MALQRPTSSKMASADFVQTKGFGWALCAAMYSSMAAIKSGTLWKPPRRMRLEASSRNPGATRFNHEELVGVKWRWKRGCFPSHRWTFGWVWRPRAATK